MPNKLPVSRAVAVAVSISQAGAQAQALNNCLCVGINTVIDTVEQYRSYGTLAQVAADFGTSAAEYLSAVLWFEQAPQPTSLLIGRWYKTAAAGGLRCAPLTATQQLIATWQAITTGSFKLAKDGGSLTNIPSLNFSAAGNLNAVAAIITTALTGVTCVWNAVYSRFEFVSATTGSTSAVAFLGAGTTGTDISGMLAGLSTNSGAYVYAGMALETPAAAAARFDALIGRGFYAMTMIAIANNADTASVVAYLSGSSNLHIFGATTQEAAVLGTGDTTNLAYILQQANYRRSLVQYSSTNPYAAISALARLLTVDYNGNNTVITLKFKQEPGIVAENLTSGQANALESYNCNVFAAYDNNTAIFEQGVMSDGTFADIVTNTDWFAADLQNGVWNALYTSPTKIPQTEAGMNILKGVCTGICAQAVNNGMLAPGQWNTTGFGQLSDGDYLAKGYYIFSAPVAAQDPALRAARIAVPIQVAAKLAGAIHSADILVTVNQ